MYKRSRIQINLTLRELLLLLVILVLIIATFSWTAIQGNFQPSPTPVPATITATITQTATASASPTATTTLSPTATVTPRLIIPTEGKTDALGQGLMVMAMQDGGYTHLFAYQPESLSLTRLTDHPWDDADPAINPEGTKVAFSSRQNGYWDLFLLDLIDGSLVRLTDTPAYDGSPSWSPDGQWLAYESYQSNTLDIFIAPVYDRSATASIIQLTSDAGLNYTPTWSSQGRLIAFISDRTGEPEVWLADLDRIDDRFVNISNSPQSLQSHPVWSPDGLRLAWASTASGQSNIITWDRQIPGALPQTVSPGDWPVWSPDGSLLATRQRGPNQTYLAVYQSQSGIITLPSHPMPGPLDGMDWKNASLTDPLPQSIEAAARLTPTPLWTPQVTVKTPLPEGRHGLVELKDVAAPSPMLLDQVAESFIRLRARTGNEIGWDLMASLENAFLPISGLLPPGLYDDWLYTGRSFALNPISINAGWMVVMREDYGNQTCWRIFLRARYQDGSQGRPLYQAPWDLNARYSGDPQVYEQGGSPGKSVPPGYWVDFTDLAAAYGWERLPSLINWRTYFPAIRFNQFVLRDGLDWNSAMMQVYPQEILITPTPILPPTSTPTKTPYWMRPRSPTPSRTVTTTSTPRATWTPLGP